MCGIFGGSGELNKTVITSLGCQSESRGSDSSGLAWIDKLEEAILVSKVVERGTVAFPLLLANEVEKASESNAMIGHTRMASTGKVNTKNAHPFFIDNIVFAHNGIITNYEKFGKHDCDSICLIEGIKERSFEKFSGSVALVWIENNKLHAYRKGNPLFRGKMKNAVYLASEKSMLARVGCKRIKELTEGMIYVFEKSDIVETTKVKENTCDYYMGTQSKTYKQYDLEVYNPSAPYLGVTEQEEKELEELGLGFYEKDGKRHYGKLDAEYAEVVKNLGKSKTPGKKVHAMTDMEWKNYGGV